MPGEHDAEKVEGLALVPVGGWPYVDHRRHDRKLVVGRERAHAQPPVVGERQQMIDHRKPASRPSLREMLGRRRIGTEIGEVGGFTGVSGIIDAGEIDQRFEPQFRTIAQAAHCTRKLRRRDHGGDLTKGDGELLQPVAKRRGQRRGKRLNLRRHQRAIVLVRQILFCSCRIPYRSASAVGGQPGT